MKKKYIPVSLYILIPFIFSAISLLWVIMTSNYFAESYVKPVQGNIWSFIMWIVAVFVLTYLIGLLITRTLLKPVMMLVKKAESLPAFSEQAESEEKTKDDVEHYSKVFDQIATVLSKVEAQEFFPGIVGQSRAMREIFAQVMKVAPTDSTVLILGESGTGKELVAQGVYEHSLRRGKPFVKINCVAIPESLLESELFGHEKGAFTGATAQKIGKFEVANGGTLFLDEIGDMTLATQAKILRVLQEKEFERVGGTATIKVDVRFVIATNKNLAEMVKQGLFREDLYYRINVFSINLPALRERKEDIPQLIEYFLDKRAKPIKLSPEATQVITGYSWPGNVRELMNTIERAIVLTETGLIEPVNLPGHITGFMREHGFDGQNSHDSLTIDKRLDEIEKGLIIEALTRTGGIQVKAAELLGINQRSLWHRIKKYSIDTESFKKLQKM
ncbi:MAG TPA: sigma-54 dependent transcriptional regulator [Syntrophales bacterium]|nr:sigma-54 dependent transcriptional regulator [Syntrophales bacterium]